MPSFSELNIVEPLVRALTAHGYSQPTPIQAQAIPHILAGRDLLGCAQTGTGKTAAFAIPILQQLASRPSTRSLRALVLTPTRELASQIGACFAAYGKFINVRHHVIFGGVSLHKQIQALRDTPEIIVATPGRLLDLCSQGHISFRSLEMLVLDEADRMLDMGFVHDIRRLLKIIPTQRQTVFFSATMPKSILDLAKTILRDPAKVEVAPIASTAEKIQQSVHFIPKLEKRQLLETLLQDPAITRALVFTRTKHGADRLVVQLARGRIHAVAIHANKSQNARERALADFKRGAVRVLIATDIAARGIDVDGITHVFNYDLPDVAESYVHRIGRTGRAGASGIAISFCDQEQRSLLADIERLIRMRIPVNPPALAAARG